MVTQVPPSRGQHLCQPTWAGPDPTSLLKHLPSDTSRASFPSNVCLVTRRWASPVLWNPRCPVLTSQSLPLRVWARQTC